VYRKNVFFNETVTVDLHSNESETRDQMDHHNLHFMTYVVAYNPFFDETIDLDLYSDVAKNL